MYKNQNRHICYTAWMVIAFLWRRRKRKMFFYSTPSDTTWVIYLTFCRISHKRVVNRRSNLQTLFISFFVIFILFDLYSTIVFRFTLSYVPYYLQDYYDMGGPKKCRNIYKLDKYKNKIYTTQQNHIFYLYHFFTICH